MALWTHQNIKAWTYMNDHCEPHVTFDCPADGWKARIQFSMVKPDVALIDVKPLKNIPSRAVLNTLANQLEQRLTQCRLEWWQTKNGELCIDKRSVERVGKCRVLMDGPNPTGKIVPKSGAYVPNHQGRHHVTASVLWRNGVMTHNEVVQ